ncbi:Histidinol-phosphatase [alternative form] [hydrothermal vent metagenome]|uniref:histidinol-phosphatase n=1 Tax=hydrothermal vent metagenome TaxID=652676 RepID=A0A3B1ADP8_9ZZZZ
MDNLEKFLHELCDAAALETMKLFRQPMDVANKEADNNDGRGFDPVTLADKAAEKAIRSIISRKYPEHGILGEEYGEDNSGAEFCWIIDPIDGTRSYISGLPLWGTLIGLYKNGEPLAGVMHQPFTGERYLSDGSHSILVHNAKRQKIKGRKSSSLENCVMLTTSPKLFDGAELDAYERVEAACKLTRYGADCYAYAMVASGQVDLVVESKLFIYDIAALIPIVENAGGRMSNWQGGSAAQGGQVLACGNAEIHAEAIALLNAS